MVKQFDMIGYKCINGNIILARVHSWITLFHEINFKENEFNSVAENFLSKIFDEI